MLIHVKEQGCGDREAVVGVEHAECDRMPLAVAQHAGKRRQVHAIRYEAQRLHSGDRLPEKWVDTSAVNPWIHRRHAGRLTVNADLGLAKGSATAALQRPSHVVRDTGIPEFVDALALRDDIKVGMLDVARQIKCGGQLVG